MRAFGPATGRRLANSLGSMPIVTVELVTEPDRPLEHNLTQSLADTIGRVLSSPPGQSWVRLRLLPRDGYAENDALVDAAELPVFVTLLERQPPTGAELQAEVAALTHAIAQVIGRPATCVHVEYLPAAVGRVSFGGKLVQ
jgi:phenylpyruvate tautomerase PptA (4-oxalocrotonate tautomerase family)